MTREDFYNSCLKAIKLTNCLLVEATTGYGKSKISIDLVNGLSETEGRRFKVLLLIAKKAHRITWKNEIAKWGGINADVTMECYESLCKHVNESFDAIIADETHHIKSEKRKNECRHINFKYYIGLSATIPRSLKQWFEWNYNAIAVKCDLPEAIEDEVLPEPEFLLFPLKLDNTKNTEVFEVNPNSIGKPVYDEYRFLWKYKKNRQHAFLSCTQKQRSNEYNNECLKLKRRHIATRNEGIKNIWLQQCGKRLAFYANCKVPIVKMILEHLKDHRTITFCKTIEQCEQLGKNCIHSKNGKLAEKYYNDFNAKKIKHITAVNILNENANLVDCKYAVFGNIPGSETVQIQRIGRSLRHKKPVIIIPYYESTVEEEKVVKWMADFDKDYIRVIHSVEEI